MEKSAAYSIIQTTKLIPGKISRVILNKIIAHHTISPEELPEGITPSQIDDLRIAYKNKVSELNYQKIIPKITPRYLPFYLLIKEKIANFFWEHSAANPNIYISSPRVKNLRPSLLSLLLDKIDSSKDTILDRKYSCLEKLPRKSISLLDRFMTENTIFYPPADEMQDVMRALSASLAGDQLTVFVPVCPDYAFEYTQDKNCPIRFTFTSLESGNGIIAQWLLQHLAQLQQTLQQCGIPAKFVVALTDYEAFSASNLQSFNLSEAEFLDKVYLSSQVFKMACPIDAEVVLFTDLCPKAQWLELMANVNNRFIKDDYGHSKINQAILMEIVENRKALYSRWYGERENLADYIEIVKEHGLMYAAMGYVLKQHFSNCLVFAADNKVMRYFYSVAGRMPCLYINKQYF